MVEYRSNISIADVARRLGEAKSVIVITHAKPDGDAFGSVVALAGALRGGKRQVNAWFAPPVPESLAILCGAEHVDLFENGSTFGEADLVVVVDTGATSQLAPMLAQLEPHLPHTLIIDHHLTGDLPAQWRYIDGEAAACCEIVAAVLDEMGIGLNDPVVSKALFVGIASDTGWFRFANTRPKTHQLAARLLLADVNHSQLYAQLELNERAEKLALMSRALDSLQLLAGGSVAVMVLRAEDFVETGADVSETERFVDIPQVVASVQTVVLITQPPATDDDDQPAIRLSFRSKPGDGARNVADVAGLFGGGGHARAAGARVAEPLDRVIRRVTEAVS